jgi:peroxin-1
VLPARLVHFPGFTTPSDGKTHAYIHPYTLSLLTSTRYIPFDPNPDPPRSGWWCARVRLLEPPKDPTDILNGNSTGAKSTADAKREDGEAKVLHPGSEGDAGEKTDERNEKDGWEVWLGISDRVLETHVMFVGEMKGKVNDWDLVRCAALFFCVLAHHC